MIKYNFSLILGLIFLLNTVVFASFTIPDYVYRIDELRTAIRKAKYKNIPIVFLFSDKNTTCGLAASASRDVFEEYKNSAIIIYCSSEGDNYLDGLPKIISQEIESPYTGKYIPKTIITDSRVRFVYETIPYIRDRNQRKSTLHEVITVIQHSIDFLKH
ncbi:MAG: hypothetical protein GQ534_03165 [Candidatus Delongbacteria bacterium]|nr:hypothetical protein [Candidatus Delongbacteria bacterium]